MTFSPRYVLGDLDLTEYPFHIYWGSDYGSPQNVAEVVDSMLVDGEVEISTRSSNREMRFSVLVWEADLGALADAETALWIECDKQRNEFSIDPGDGIAAVTVFETFRVQATFVHDDDMEWQGYRRYDLTWRALPYGRSETETTVAALAVGAGSETTISDGTSATGWTSPDGSVTVSSGKLHVPAPASPDSTYETDVGTYGVYTPEATVTLAATNFSTTPFLWFEHQSATAGVGSYVDAVYVDGVEVPKVSDAYVSSLSARRAVFYVTDTSATTIRIVFSKRVPIGTDTSVLIDNVKRGPRSPKASTTGRENIRSLTIGGSARTQASLQVAHASAGLGDAIVFTAPGLGTGYSPDLAQFYVSGGSVASDAATVSGQRFTTNSAGGINFDVPASSLPSGGYTIYARVRASTVIHSRVISWAASTRVGSTTLGTVRSGTSNTVSLDTTAWTIVAIGTVTLPTVQTAEAAQALVRMMVGRGSSGNEIQIDQAWLFYRGDGSALSIVHAGAGTPAIGTIHNRLWLDSATLASTNPAVWVGTVSTKTDAIHGGIFADEWEVPDFPVGDLGVFVVTTSATDAAVSGRYFKRWHTHAAEAE